eukprot:1841202-Lingulodinium_polyedra.AAC.1
MRDKFSAEGLADFFRGPDGARAEGEAGRVRQGDVWICVEHVHGARAARGPRRVAGREARGARPGPS